MKSFLITFKSQLILIFRSVAVWRNLFQRKNSRIILWKTLVVIGFTL